MRTTTGATASTAAVAGVADGEVEADVRPGVDATLAAFRNTRASR